MEIQDILSISDDEFPLYLYVEGLGAESINCESFRGRGRILPEGGAPRVFVWSPYEHEGDLAYGYLPLIVQLPDTQMRFCFQVVPREIYAQLWPILFRDICRVADGLATDLFCSRNPLLNTETTETSTRFSASTAFSELSHEWEILESSVYRIQRRPRCEFTLAHPSMPRRSQEEFDPIPVANSDIYENRLVVITAQRLISMLSEISRRAESTIQSEESTLDFLRNSHNIEALREQAKERIQKCRLICDTAAVRLRFLRHFIREMSQVRIVRDLRAQVPHITPRIKLHPDYNRIMQWWRQFGKQKFAQSRPNSLSDLTTRRSSALYEYWTVLGLFTMIKQIGFRPELSDISELVSDDLLDLHLVRDRPIRFMNDDSSAVITLWYEPKAKFLPKPGSDRAMRLTDWNLFCSNEVALAPGFYSRPGPRTPDYILELSGEGIHRFIVGDAIFSEGIERKTGQPIQAVAAKKARTVSEYVRDIVVIRDSRPLRLHADGFVIFCGFDSDIPLLDADASEHSVAFLAMRPNADKKSAEGSAEIIVEAATLERFRQMIEEVLPMPVSEPA